MTQTSASNAYQVSGDHYHKPNAPQPWDVIIAWNLGYLEGNALKYISRWKAKGGVTDLKKAIHYLEKLIEVTEAEAQPKYLFDPVTGIKTLLPKS